MCYIVSIWRYYEKWEKIPSVSLFSLYRVPMRRDELVEAGEAGGEWRMPVGAERDLVWKVR